MSFTRCPHCDNPLTPDERKAPTCPACNQPLTGAVTARESPWKRPAPDPSWEEAAGPSFSGFGWGTVRTALALVGVGLILLVGGLVFLVSLTANRTGRPTPGTEVGTVFFGLMAATGLVQVVTGMCMCSVVPAEGARGWAIGNVFCLAAIGLIALLLFLGQAKNREAERRNLDTQRRNLDALLQEPVIAGQPRRFDLPPPPEKMPFSSGALRALNHALHVAGLLAGVCFTCFLWQLARLLQNRSLAVGLLVYLVVTVIINASFVILSLTGALESAAGNFVGKFGPEVLTWVVLGLSVAILVWLTLLVFLVRGTLTRALLRQPT